MVLVHRRVLGGAVHLARREEDEALDRRLAHGVEQDLRPLDIGRHELARTFVDRLLHVRLSGRIHDHVDLGDDLPHELGVADVAVHEREALVRHRTAQIVEVARVRERI